jgi:hypothetical protein
MLVILWSSNLSFSLTAARVAEWRDIDGASRARLVLTDRCTGNVRLAAAGPDRVGTGTGVMTGGGIAGTLAALPMPLGSLTEPFNPRAFAGPGGIPLTPASWAGAGVASKPSTATLMNATLPIVHPREKILTDCTRLMDRWSLADLSYPGGRTYQRFIWFQRILASSRDTGVMGCTGDDVAKPGMRRLVVEASQPNHASLDRLGRTRQPTEHKLMRSCHAPGDIERKHRYQVGRRQDLRRRQEWRPHRRFWGRL